MLSPINDRLLLIMTENYVNPPINKDPKKETNLSITPRMYIYMFYCVVPEHINTKRLIVTNAYLSNKVHFDKISHHANEVLVFVLPERITFGHED